MRGFKFHPNTQAFWPNDPAFFPLYDVIAQAGLIALFHSGHDRHRRRDAGRRRGAPEVLQPDGASTTWRPSSRAWTSSSPTRPSRGRRRRWRSRSHKPNVYIDLSGWSPKYFPEILVQYINTRLRDKMLFGSDFPLITPDRWLSDFEKLPIRDEVRPLVLKDNAARLLGLG